MKRHETTAVKIAARIPRHLRGASAKQIVQYCIEHWKTQTRFDPDTGKTTPTGLATKMLFATADALFDPNDWKAPFYARFPQDAGGRDATEWAKAAAIWYHGSKPYKTYAGVGSPGYAC